MKDLVQTNGMKWNYNSVVTMNIDIRNEKWGMNYLIRIMSSLVVNHFKKDIFNNSTYFLKYLIEILLRVVCSYFEWLSIYIHARTFVVKFLIISWDNQTIVHLCTYCSGSFHFLTLPYWVFKIDYENFFYRSGKQIFIRNIFIVMRIKKKCR